MAKNSALRAVELPPTAVEPAPSVPLRIDIGCGKTTPEGWVGIDKMDFGQKHVFNVAKVSNAWYRQNHEWMMGERELPPDVPKYYPLPFDDNSVDEVRSSHFVEHLTGEERIHLFNELWRIMKPGATALIITPNWSHECAYGDWTHQWPPMSKWYPLYLHKDWLVTNGPHVGLECHYDHVVAGSWDASIETRNAEYKQMAMQNYTNAFRDLIVTLTKRE